MAPIEAGNAILLAMTGGKRVEPGPLFTMVLLFGVSRQLVVLGSMWAGRIIGGLLRFARQSEDGMVTTDMRDVVTSTPEFRRSRLRRRGAEVRVDLPHVESSTFTVSLPVLAS